MHLFSLRISSLECILTRTLFQLRTFCLHSCVPRRICPREGLAIFVHTILCTPEVGPTWIDFFGIADTATSRENAACSARIWSLTIHPHIRAGAHITIHQHMGLRRGAYARHHPLIAQARAHYRSSTHATHTRGAQGRCQTMMRKDEKIVRATILVLLSPTYWLVSCGLDTLNIYSLLLLCSVHELSSCST